MLTYIFWFFLIGLVLGGRPIHAAGLAFGWYVVGPALINMLG